MFDPAASNWVFDLFSRDRLNACMAHYLAKTVCRQNVLQIRYMKTILFENEVKTLKILTRFHVSFYSYQWNLLHTTNSLEKKKMYVTFVFKKFSKFFSLHNSYINFSLNFAVYEGSNFVSSFIILFVFLERVY